MKLLMNCFSIKYDISSSLLLLESWIFFKNYTERKKLLSLRRKPVITIHDKSFNKKQGTFQTGYNIQKNKQ